MTTSSSLVHDLEADSIREQIIDAAQARFRFYGYRKTTMAEIAADVAMSAANLYRYFENKQDIAAACAKRYLLDRIAFLREIVQRPGLAATERLEAFVVGLEARGQRLGVVRGRKGHLDGVALPGIAQWTECLPGKPLVFSADKVCALPGDAEKKAANTKVSIRDPHFAFVDRRQYLFK